MRCGARHPYWDDAPRMRDVARPRYGTDWSVVPYFAFTALIIESAIVLWASAEGWIPSSVT